MCEGRAAKLTTGRFRQVHVRVAVGSNQNPVTLKRGTWIFGRAVKNARDIQLAASPAKVRIGGCHRDRDIVDMGEPQTVRISFRIEAEANMLANA